MVRNILNVSGDGRIIIIIIIKGSSRNRRGRAGRGGRGLDWSGSG